jgi:hypothetical protein
MVIGLNAPFRFGKYVNYSIRGFYTILGIIMIVYPDLGIKYVTVTVMTVILAATRLLQERPFGDIKKAYFS